MLSKKDVEELGWKYSKNVTERTKEFKYKNYQLFHNTENSRIRIGTKDENEIQGYKEYFDGTVETKEDLIVLLRLINKNAKQSR